MQRCWRVTIFIAALATAQFSLAQTPRERSLPIDIDVPAAPIPVRGAGATHLFYELHLTNFSGLSFELTRVEIHADGRDVPLAAYSGQEIASRLIRPGTPADLPDKRVLDRGLRAILMVHVPIENQRDVPTRLWHRLTFAFTPAGRALEDTIDGGRVTLAGGPPLVIAPPLRGGDWLAANGPSNESDHRRALMVVNGRAHIAQRLAIDWIKLGPGGRLAHDDRSRNENWFAYGEEVLAVADGTEGMPYIFESGQYRGSVASLDKLFADEPWIPQGGTVVRTREIPLENAVVRFP